MCVFIPVVSGKAVREGLKLLDKGAEAITEANTAYRYVGEGEKAYIEKDGYIPNVDINLKIKRCICFSK